MMDSSLKFPKLEVEVARMSRPEVQLSCATPSSSIEASPNDSLAKLHRAANETNSFYRRVLSLPHDLACVVAHFLFRCPAIQNSRLSPKGIPEGQT